MVEIILHVIVIIVLMALISKRESNNINILYVPLLFINFVMLIIQIVVRFM